MAGHIAGALPPNPYLLFLSWCPSFLPLMEEKKQKKIKASPRPGKLGRVRGRPLNVPARGESGFLHSSLAARLVGVCDTPLPRYVHHLQERAQGLDVFLGGAAFEAAVEVIAGQAGMGEAAEGVAGIGAQSAAEQEGCLARIIL